jgi:tetratricopeptide (TPR) repeat protein
LAVAALLAVSWWYYATTRPDYRLKKGQEALRNGDVREAERLIARLDSSGYPTHAHLLRGEALLRAQDFERADAELKEVGPEQTDLYLQAAALRGQALMTLEPYEAQQTFLAVLKLQPDNLIAHRGLAEMYFQRAALLAAQTHLEEVARLDPGDGRAFRYLGLIDRFYRRSREATRNFEEALKRHLSAHDAEETRAELALSLFDDREYAHVLQVLDTCQPASRDVPRFRHLRATCLWEMGRADEARQEADRGLAAHPDSALLLALRGTIYLTDGKPDKAALVLEKAVRLEPFEMETRHELAKAYQRLDQPEEAAEQLRVSNELRATVNQLNDLMIEARRKPTDAAIRLEVARLARRLGKKDMAARWEMAAAICSAAPEPSVAQKP